MDDVRAIAKRLLADGAVDVVIGHGDAGRHRTVPLFARTAAQAERLVVSPSALNNLAVYLTRAMRPAGERVAVVAKGCDVRAIVMLIAEGQIERSQVVIIGVECGGVTERMGDVPSAQTIAAKCHDCAVRTPTLFDELVGMATVHAADGALAGAGSPHLAGSGPRDGGAIEPTVNTTDRRIAAIEAMTAGERFDFWTAELERCTRCYACRQACPLCYCTQCVVDRNVPQWIETSATPRANLSWNLIRAFHLAGRCVGCNECERACPAGIPLSLLNRYLSGVAEREFDFRAGLDPAAPPLVGSYDLADGQDYIR